MSFITLLLALTPFAQSALVPSQEFLTSDFYAKEFSGVVFAGGDSIGSGDTVDGRRHSVWFYGDQPIQTCLQVSVNFGVDPSAAIASTKEAIQSWQDYFKAKAIGKDLPKENQINTNFVVKENCEGGEDLVLYLGTGPIFFGLEDLRARQSLSRPVAYVNKVQMATDLKWSKGYIRFVEPFLYSLSEGRFFPDWNLGFSFKNFLKHEIGHVLGFAHVPKTVMDPQIAVHHFLKDDWSQTVLAIDGGSELFSCEHCLSVYVAKNKQESPFEAFTLQSGNLWAKKKDSPKKPVVVVDQIMDEANLKVLSFFNSQDYVNPTARILFISVDGEFYSIEVKNHATLQLRKNGRVVATFEKLEVL